MNRKISTIIQSAKIQFIGTVIFLFLLPVLAIFQYYWLGQLSDAEKIRMKNNLQMSAERFSEEFDKELTAIYTSFNEITLNTETKKSEILNDTYINWKKKSNFPGIIQSIYAINLTPKQDIQFYKLDTNNTELKAVKWPQKYLFLKKYLNNDINNVFFRLITLTHGPILKPISMIVVTQPSEILIDSIEENCIDNWLIIVVLDENILMNHFMPSLVKKYFYQEDELNYNLIILKEGEASEEFYKSEGYLTPSDFINPDVQTNIGSWRTRNMIIAAAQYVSDKSEVNITKKIKKEKSLSIKVLTGDSTQNTETSKYLIAKIDRWNLMVKHAEGSLEVIVTKARIRNLLISYIIILILGIGIILALVSTRRLQRISQQQLEFVAGVTHELRTPLAVIQSAGENIVDGVVKSKEQYTKYGSLIRDEGKRLSNMVEQVLDYAGIQSKKQLSKFEKLSLTELIDEINLKFNKNSKINFENKCGDLIIKGDKNALNIALSNIIDNSTKYCTENSHINIFADISSDKNFYIIKITDNGLGIDKEDIQKIFKPFYRGKNATNNSIPGSGLGLSLVKGIIENHGGALTVKSEQMKGSTFTIKIPVFENNKQT
jgi:signal transduction histidine kinase